MDRLLKIQRDLMESYNENPAELESVFFPGDTTNPPPTAEPDEQEYTGNYQQSTKEPDEPGKMVPVSGSKDSDSDKQSSRDQSERSPTTKDQSDSEPEVESASRIKTESGTNVRYRRVGSTIRVVDGSSTSPSSVEGNTVESDSDEIHEILKDSSQTERTESPNLNLNNTGASPSSFLPAPDLRSADPGPPLRNPEE
jgi:hypothetical protein